MALKALLGSKLLKDDTTVDTESLEGKVVGLYFSAHWCPPCRGFTPVLAEKYKEVQAAGKNFEIVFVSSDRDEDSFKEYFNDMPWLALPYEERDMKAKLSKKYKVSGIPSLIILDESGKVITTDGRSAVTDDDMVNKFPWKPPTLSDTLSGATLVDNKGTEVSFQSLQDKGGYLGFYFSAHWCPPCRGFTPELVKTYNTLKAAGKPFEIIFASSDKHEEAFKEYFAEMPWLAVPYSEKSKIKEPLSKIFEVSGIPTFVMVEAATLKVINAKARGAVGSDPSGANFPWHPKLVNDLEECDELNDYPTIVAMMEEASGEWDAVERALNTVAKEISGASTGGSCSDTGDSAGKCADAADADGDEELKFAVAKETGGIAGQIRKLFKMGSAGEKAELVLLDLSNQGSFYVHKGDVTEESARKVIQDFKDKNLTMDSLRK